MRIAVLLLVLAACGDKKTRKDPPPPADAPGRAIIDRTAELTAILSHWDTPGAADAIYAMAHPRFQKSVTLDELRVFHEDYSARAGRFVAVKSSQGIIHTNQAGQDEDVVRGLVQFERGEAPYELVMSDHEGKPAMVVLKLELPPALQAPPDRAAARALATAFNQSLLAVDVTAIDAASLPRIRGQVSPDDAKRMRAVIAALGAKPRIEVESDRECGDVLHCLRYRVVGPRGKAIIEQTLSAPLGRWRVVNWKFEPEEKPAP